jgi:sulfur transfer protein SufE
LSSYEFNLQRKFRLVPDEHEQESFEKVKLKDCNQRQELVGSAAHIDTIHFYHSSDSSISQGFLNPNRKAAPDGA